MSVTAAGSRIVFIVLGNTVGGLFTGWLVSRTGLYKLLTIAATILGNVCYLLVLLRWQGPSSWADTWYVTLGGIGMGCTQNTTFVHLTVALDPEYMAIAGTTWFLSQGIGMLVAANLFNMIHNVTLVECLHRALRGVDNQRHVGKTRLPKRGLAHDGLDYQWRALRHRIHFFPSSVIEGQSVASLCR